jgi:omega-hydroxy-beta-dihydromenaquinone-9 sulfotransferase
MKTSGGLIENSPAINCTIHPPFFLGSTLPAWFRLLADSGFAVAPRRLPWAIGVTLAALSGSLLNAVHDLVWERRIRHTPISHPPLFIIGHWRSGTTWLHELLTLDEAHSYPNTYECFVPYRFLLTEWFDLHYMTPLFNALLPKRRPFDNVVMGWQRPQEDEFALCNLGLPSPYRRIAFPNVVSDKEYFDLEGLSSQALERWKDTFLSYLRRLTVRDSRRIVLKSPTHTYRVKVLLDLFPEAQFVHIVRDPYVVFSSTMHLWKALYLNQGFQKPDFVGLEEYVFDNFLQLHKKLNEARPLLNTENFYELRYEDLVQAPVREIRRLYEHLNLGDVELMMPRLNEYLLGSRSYRTNQYEMPPDLREKIKQRWASIIQRYEY